MILLLYVFDYSLLLVYLFVDDFTMPRLLLAQRAFDLVGRRAHLPFVEGRQRVCTPDGRLTGQAN